MANTDEDQMRREIPGVVPMLDYEDASAAIRWLERAFGFREQFRIPGSEGRIDHAELDTGHGVIMLASAPSPHYLCPKRLREVFEPARAWSAVPWVIDGVLVMVDDLDTHYRRAKEAGAAILSEPEDGPPARRYRAEDLEGHRWMFMQRLETPPNKANTADARPSRD
jgi:uncharacterized glyoxalase superfamily protein PhnB